MLQNLSAGCRRLLRLVSSMNTSAGDMVDRPSSPGRWCQSCSTRANSSADSCLTKCPPLSHDEMKTHHSINCKQLFRASHSLVLHVKSGSTRASLYKAQQACRPQESPSGLMVKTLLKHVKANSPSIHKSALVEKLWPAGTAGEQIVTAETLVQLQCWTITSSFLLFVLQR